MYINIYIGMTLTSVPGFFWTNWRILTKLMCVYMIKSWLSLYDPDLFFKVTLGLKLPNLSKMIPPDQLMNCEWIYMYVF